MSITTNWNIGATPNVTWNTADENVVLPGDASLGGTFDELNIVPLLLDNQEFYFGDEFDYGLSYKSSFDKLVFEESEGGKNLMSLTKTGTLELSQQDELPDTTITGDPGKSYGAFSFHDNNLYVLTDTVEGPL